MVCTTRKLIRRNLGNGFLHELSMSYSTAESSLALYSKPRWPPHPHMVKSLIRSSELLGQFQRNLETQKYSKIFFRTGGPITMKLGMWHKGLWSIIVYSINGTSRQRSGKGAIRKRFPLQKQRWEKNQTIRHLYHDTYRKPNEQLFSQ